MAAGGGGDALASLAVNRSLGLPTQTPLVASFSWDRYLIDPTPGPRSTQDFAGLRATGHVQEVTADSTLLTGGRSGLSILARHTDARYMLLDPSNGGCGLSAQVNQITHELGVGRIVLVDVGGDIVAAGDEPRLASPLADSLALAAVADARVPVEVVVAGPGLDGELDAGYVRRRLVDHGGRRHLLDRDDAKSCLAALEHHPSEAAALLVASARGVAGSVEIRDSAALVQVGDTSAEIWTISSSAAQELNGLARILATTRSFHEAEARAREFCGHTELDHERRKAARLAAEPSTEPATRSELQSRFARYRSAAAGRGATHVSFRRLTEVLGFRDYSPSRVRQLVGALALEGLPFARLGS